LFLHFKIKPEYESFDDWIEIIIQFGYVVLFSACFPFAGFLAFLSNIVEIRSDYFKLLFVFRRPRKLQDENIGVWLNVFKALSYCSILTNAIIFGFTSDQLETLFVGEHFR
jgi:hypothetical protein